MKNTFTTTSLVCKESVIKELMKFYSIKNNNFTYEHYAYRLSPKKFYELEKLYYYEDKMRKSVWVFQVEDNYYEFRCKWEDDENVIKFCNKHMER